MAASTVSETSLGSSLRNSGSSVSARNLPEALTLTFTAPPPAATSISRVSSWAWSSSIDRCIFCACLSSFPTPGMGAMLARRAGNNEAFLNKISVRLPSPRRLLSAILTATLGTALFCEVRRQTGKWAAGLLAVLLYVSSTQIFAWYPTVKTYALSTLLLFLAYRTVIRSCAVTAMTWFAAGLLLAASADVRLYFAGLLPVFLWWIYGSTRTGGRAAALLCFLGGFALAPVPWLCVPGADPQNFIFDNLGLHAIRAQQGLIGDFAGKTTMAVRLLLARVEDSEQLTMLFFLVVVLSIRRGIVTPAARRAATLGLALILDRKST